MAKTEAGAEHPSLSLHSLPSESDCFGDIVTSYSEDSAALMAICIKSEPEDQHISHPEYCTEVQGFSAEEMNSGLHLDTNQIKTEMLMVKIQEEGKVFCPTLEQFNSPVSFLSKQYKSETDEVKVEQHSQLQETSCILNDISEAAHCIKDEWTELKLSVLSAVPCTLSKKCKSETDEVKVDQHSQLEGSCSSGSQINNSAIHSLKEVCVNLHVNEFRSVPCSSVQCKFETNAVKIEQPSQLQGSSCTELEINNSANNSMERYPPVQVAHKLLQSNSEKLESCLIIAGADAQTKGALEQPGGCVTSTFTHKATEQPRNGGVTCSAQKWQFLQGKEVLESQSHLKIYLQNGPGYKHCCVQSGTSFSKAVQLKQHQLVHSGETPYKCSECGKTFSCLSTFQQHQLANSSKFKCIHCGKSFFRGSHLKQHQLVHSGEKPYKCSECGKTFSREYNLQLHQLVHSGEKPHECDVCGKSFSHGSTLKRHQVIHTGEKPYKCECGKSFSSKQYFKKHAATHGIFYANSP